MCENKLTAAESRWSLRPDAQVDATSEQRRLRLDGGSIHIVAGNLRGDDDPITGLHAGTTKSG